MTDQPLPIDTKRMHKWSKVGGECLVCGEGFWGNKPCNPLSKKSPDILTLEAIDTLTQADIAEAILALERHDMKNETELAWYLVRQTGATYPYCAEIAEKAFERMAQNDSTATG